MTAQNPRTRQKRSAGSASAYVIGCSATTLCLVFGYLAVGAWLPQAVDPIRTAAAVANSSTAELRSPFDTKPRASLDVLDVTPLGSAGGNAWFGATQIELGAIPQGRPVRLRIPFVNRSNRPAAIDSIEAGCSCTSLALGTDRERYRVENSRMVRESDNCTVEFVECVKGTMGYVEAVLVIKEPSTRKTVPIDLATSDPNLPHIRIRLGAHTESGIALTPSVLDFGDLLAGSVREFTIQIASAESVRLSAVPESLSDLEIQTDSTHVTITGKHLARLGSTEEELLLEIGDCHLTVPVLCRVRPEFAIQPGKTIALGLLQVGSDREIELSIADNRQPGKRAEIAWAKLESATDSMKVAANIAPFDRDSRVVKVSFRPQLGANKILRGTFRLGIHGSGETLSCAVFGLIESGAARSVK